MNIILVWLMPLLATHSTACYFIKLYLKDNDKRKLAFAIVFFLASIDHIFLLFNIDFSTSIAMANVFSFSSIPLQVLILVALIESFNEIKNFDKFFNLFIIFISLSILLMWVLPFSVKPILILPKRILALISIVLSFHIFLTRKNQTALLLGMSASSFTVAGIGMSYKLTELAAFAFFIAYIFIYLIFSKAEHGIKLDLYFSLKRRLEETEKKLRLSEERYRIIVENTSDVITVNDQRGRITYISPSCKKLFGYEPTELIWALPWQKFVHPEDASMVFSHHRRQSFYNNDANNPAVFRIITKDGKIKWVSASISPIENNGEIIGYVTSYRDITETKRMEEELSKKVKELERAQRAYLSILEDLKKNIEKLEKAKEEIRKKNKELSEINRSLEERVRERTEEVRRLIKSKEELLMQISHDIKTPLTPLLTLLPIARDKIDNPNIKRLLDVCIRNAVYMKDLITDTLQLMRVERMGLNMESFNLKAEMEDVVKNHMVYAEKEGITIDISVDDNLFIRADRIRFREVMDNLISNAIKYNVQNGKIFVGAEKEDGMVKIYVKDTGKGMTEEEIEHVFDEFYKGDKAGHDLTSIGVGLSICKKIVEKHGGKIWAESDGPGKGSTFYFTFPSGEIEKTVEQVIERE